MPNSNEEDEEVNEISSSKGSLVLLQKDDELVYSIEKLVEVEVALPTPKEKSTQTSLSSVIVILQGLISICLV